MTAPSESGPDGGLDSAAPLSGAKVGYARVSTSGQLLDRQIAALNAAGCIRVLADKKSGKDAEREELWRTLDYLRPGDTLVVASLGRLGRSLSDLISIVTGLRRRGIGFASPHEALDTTGHRSNSAELCGLGPFGPALPAFSMIVSHEGVEP